MSDAQLVTLLQSGYANLEWLQQNIEQLKHDHDQEFVAIFDGAIVASSRNIEGLMESLQTQKIDAASVLITHISKVKEIL